LLALISIFIFLAVVLTIVGINSLIITKSERIRTRLYSITQESKEEASDPEKLNPKREFTVLLNTLGKRFVTISFTKKLQSELAKADLLLRAEEFIGLNILLAFGLGLVGLLLFGRGLPTLIFALIGIMIPWFLVSRKKQARVAFLNSEIGDSLTGMSNSLRAGYSFQQAMDLVCKETTGPLSQEYRRTLREINLGITTEQALQNLVHRGDNEDLELLIGAVLIQRQTGGNLAEIFDNIADTIRQRIRMQGEVRTLTAQGRMSGLIIGSLPVILFLLIMVINPSYMEVLLSRSLGWMLLAGAAVSETIGFIFIRNITNIEF
jgi:tight adherence protein B